ncbi:hypothetical protein CH063_15715, partial [Colletotrichum higginsianum]
PVGEVFASESFQALPRHQCFNDLNETTGQYVAFFDRPVIDRKLHDLPSDVDITFLLASR